MKKLFGIFLILVAISISQNLEAQENRTLIERGADGEYDDTRGKTNQNLLQHQKDLIKDQDAQLDNLAGVVQGIKYENQNFNAEVTDQN